MGIRVTINSIIKNGDVQNCMDFIKANLGRVRSFDGAMRVSVMLNQNTRELLLDEEWISEPHHQNYIQAITENGVGAQFLVVSFFKEQETGQFAVRCEESYEADVPAAVAFGQRIA